MKIAVPAERPNEESRAAATPETVKKHIGLSAEFAVEAGAGANARGADAALVSARPTLGYRAAARGTDALASLTVRVPADVRPAAELLRKASETLFNARVALSHNIASAEPTVDGNGEVLATSVFGWADADGDCWWRTPQLAITSPIAAACRFESEPFWCTAQGFFTDQPNPRLVEVDRWQFEKRAMCKAAIVVPVHLPYGHIGMACFVPNDPRRTDLAEPFAAHGALLGLYARTFIASYNKVMSNREQLPTRTLLTGREVGCLKWAAAGKTDEEIAVILDVSRSTIRFHLINAKRKLDTVTRGQTLFKAAQLGYIALTRTDPAKLGGSPGESNDCLRDSPAAVHEPCCV